LFRIFDEFSQQVSIFEKHFDDDLCAYKYARLLAQENVVEIWDGGYLVAYVKLGDVAPTKSDPRAVLECRSPAGDVPK